VIFVIPGKLLIEILSLVDPKFVLIFFTILYWPLNIIYILKSTLQPFFLPDEILNNTRYFIYQVC